MRSIVLFLMTILSLSLVPAQVDAQEKRFPVIRITISKGQYNNLRNNTTQKVTLSNPLFLIDQDTAHVKEIHVRGNNSRKFKRKSLSVELDKSITIRADEKKTHLKKFDLLNLSMDKNLWHNRWSNLNLETMGLFPLANFYCTLWINDEPQGIYLLVEKPQHAMSRLNCPYMLRRGPNHIIDGEYFDDAAKEDAKKYRKQFQSIYTTIRSTKGAAMASQLSVDINLDSYFQFLGFNYLVMNGDYADEVFFYIDSKTQSFDIIPWDYDDIMRSAPHEGREERNRQFTDKKIFSLEESLDLAIASNPELYTRYEKYLRKTMLDLDSASLTSKAYRVISELEELSHDKRTAEASLFLDQQPFEFNQAKADILNSIQMILNRRKWILEQVK